MLKGGEKQDGLWTHQIVAVFYSFGSFYSTAWPSSFYMFYT